MDTNNNQQIENASMPSYQEILQEMGRQLNNRKGTLVKRVFLIIWPLLTLLVALAIITKLYKMEILVEDSPLFIVTIIALCLWTVFTVFYSAIVRIIFATEKLIWIDSYFDQKNVEPHASWHIAKKLFWPAFGMKIQLFWRFYFLPFFLYFFLLILDIILMVKFDIKLHWSVFPIILLGGPILIWVYAYYLRIKLRYAWFLFLDSYGTSDFSYPSLFQEMKKLNEVSKSESFKKALVANVGADSLETIAQSAINMIGSGLGNFGDAGKLAGALLSTTGEEMTRQASSFGKIAAMYILYRFACQELYQKSQKVNEFVYSLAESK